MNRRILASHLDSLGLGSQYCSNYFKITSCVCCALFCLWTRSTDSDSAMVFCEACNEGKLIAEEGGLVCPLCGYYEEEIQLDATTIAPRGGNIYKPSNFIKTTKGHRLPGQMVADVRFDIQLVRPHRPFTRIQSLTDRLAEPRKAGD